MNNKKNMSDKLNYESDIIMVVDKQYLIETNEKILKKREKEKKVRVWIGTTNTINDIIPHVDSVGIYHITNQQKVIESKLLVLLTNNDL